MFAAGIAWRVIPARTNVIPATGIVLDADTVCTRSPAWAASNIIHGRC